MSRAIDLDEVIGLAYEAALAPQRWSEVLEGAADMLGGEAGALHFQDQVTGKGWGMVARLDPAAAQSYFGYFATRNPIRQARNRLLRLADNSHRWRAQVVTDEHALPKTELMRSEYYNDFLQRFDIHSLLMMGLAVESTKFATVNFLRPRRSSQFETDAIDLATRLQPHFIRAFDLSVRLSELRQMNANLAESLDRSPHGVFLVGADARVRHLNRTAETLAAGRRGLAVRNGVLCAETADSTRALHRLIAAAGGADDKRRGGGAMPVERPDCRRPLSVIVAPLHPEQIAPFPPEPLALVCATDPDCGVAAPEDRVRALFGFTAAEAKIAVELLAGCDPARIAERKSISVNTVRVHVQRIMTKTDTNRQADLVRLLERVSGLYVN
ncbi:MAG TPA: helix-turn-helix transcriptional regulator [Rhizomicrobium sp.]|nr:helix-turn-helix transcriptional regulator [Rhizomicrobium sp.]